MKRFHVNGASIAFLSLLGITSCHHAEKHADVQPPAAELGEVWLTTRQMQDANVVVDTAIEHDLDDTILTSGRVTLDDLRAAHVFSPVTGKVLDIRAKLGARVKKGEPLAVIESPDIGSAVSDVHKAEADLIAADHDRKRKKDLFELRAAAAADLEASEDAWRKAKAELERARQKQLLLRVGNVDAVTQSYVLPSPIDGEILLRNINPGIEVQGQYSGGATQELFTIGEIDSVWVLGDLYEMDMSRVHVGTPATVTVVAYPDKPFRGKVDWVSGMLDPSTRTAKVRCTFENKARELRPEMYATVEISVDRKHVLAIPRTAVLRVGDHKIVFVEVERKADMVKFRQVPVDVDEGEGNPMLEVKHGLSPGQRIVTDGAVLLSQKAESGS